MPSSQDVQHNAHGSPGPDLLVDVEEVRQDGQVRLSYRLKTTAAQPGLTFESEPFRYDPIAYLTELFRDVEGMPQRDADDRLAAQKRLANVGAKLFRDLLPPGLRRKLWSLQGEVRTVQIISDEAWIPWELLKLQDPDNDSSSGRFFGEVFVITRWLRARPEVVELPLRRMALVVPKDCDLPGAIAERDLITALQGPEREVTQLSARFSAITDAFSSGGYDCWHFTGHGLARGDNPDRWGIVLEKGDKLTPPDLCDEARKLGRARPLIFLNACHSARGAYSLTGIGGLVRAFLDAGAGAVIGSHWAVSDDRATAFAEAFYQDFLAGVPIGEAVRQARLRIKKRFPGDPTWLAYTVFAHPLASCKKRTVVDIAPPDDPDTPGKPAADRPTERKPGVEQPELLRRVEALRGRFAESLRHYLAGGRLIPRPETTEVMAALQKTGIRLVLIHGVAGAGKSGVLYELTQRLDEEDTPYLPLRLDRQRPKVSPQHFGRIELGLPDSPVRCLQRLAGDGRVVLILDQLDALRWTSAHTSGAWDVCRELIDEALKESDAIYVVVCCRSFDLEHDPRIRAWKQAAHNLHAMAVGEISESAVREVVEGLGASYSALRPRERSLLGTVLHLKMWADVFQSTQSTPEVETSRGLMRAFWESRYDELRTGGMPRPDADRILGTLVEFMDEHTRLTAPVRRLRASEHEGKILQSLHIIQVAGGWVSFCHQSYLDYLLADRLMERLDARKMTVGQWLGERTRQSLFRREQLRLILGYLRDERPSDYLASLRELIYGQNVRFHLKHLILQFLGQVTDPRNQEVDFVLELLDLTRLRLRPTRHVILGFAKRVGRRVRSTLSRGPMTAPSGDEAKIAGTPYQLPRRESMVACCASPASGQIALGGRGIYRFISKLGSSVKKSEALDLDGLEKQQWRPHVFAKTIEWHVPWFEVLDDRGIVAEWLAAEDAELRDAAARISLCVVEQSGDRIARLLAPHEEKSEEWARRCAWILHLSPEKDSDELFALRLRLAERGFFSGEYVDWQALADTDFCRLTSLLSAVLRARVLEVAQQGEGYGLGPATRWTWHKMEAVDPGPAGNDALLAAWKRLTKTLQQLLNAARRKRGSRSILDSVGLSFRSVKPILDLLKRIACELVRRSWRNFIRVLESQDTVGVVHQLVAMKALAAGPKDSELADWALAWLMAEPSRLHLRDQGHDLPWKVAGDLIEHLAPCCSPECFERLETFLLEFREPDLIKRYRFRHEELKEVDCGLYPTVAGQTGYHLLPRLPKQHRSQRASKVIWELKRKFDGIDPVFFAGRGEVCSGRVASPISRTKILTRFSDRTWLRIIQNKKLTHSMRQWRRGGPDHIEESSVRTFSSDLGEMTRRQPERFARLALRIPEDADPAFLNAIVSRLTVSDPPTSLGPEERKQWQPASHEAMEGVLLLPAVRKNPEYARDFCWVLAHHPQQPWSEEVFRQLTQIACHHPDPAEGYFDVKIHGVEDGSAKSLEDNVLNCTRGAAGYATMELLFKHPERLAELCSAMDSLVTDRHPAVRLAGVLACLPVLNIDRDQAVTWFLAACEDDDRLLGCGYVDRFLCNTVPRGLTRLEPLVTRMVASEVADVARAGARRVAASYLLNGKLKELFERCLKGTPSHHQGLARVASQLLAEKEHHEAAKEILGRLTSDADSGVQGEIAAAFRDDLDLNLFSPADSFLVAFAGSKAFQAHPGYLLHALERHGGSLLPFAPCLLQVGRTFAEHLAKASRDFSTHIAGDAHQLGPLLLRLYEHSCEPGHAKIHHECLDLWDLLLDRRVGVANDLTRDLDRL